MSLSTDDLNAISELMDRKLASVQGAERRRRRFWAWFWIVAIVLSSVASWFIVQHYVTIIRDELAQVDHDLREARLAYQMELARNQQLQAERAAAVEVSGYDSTQDQASYEAGLLSAMLRIVGESRAHNERMQNLDPDDPDSLVAATEAMHGTMTTIMGTLGQIMLRNTDPAHNTPEENLMLGETGPPAAPAPEPTAPEMP